MGIFDMFRRGKRIVTCDVLVDFLDAQSAFLAQKGLFEYARARAGLDGKPLFDGQIFLADPEKSRWLAFPVMLAMVGEAVEGVLRLAAGAYRAAIVQGLTADPQLLKSNLCNVHDLFVRRANVPALVEILIERR